MANPNQLSPGCSKLLYGFGGLFALGLIVGGIALLGQLPSAWQTMQEKWGEAKGEVIASRVSSYETKTGLQPKNQKASDQFFVELDYRYSVESKEYSGKASAANQPKSKGNQEEAEAVAATYKAGDAVPVFYKPENASQSRLDASGPDGMFWMGVITGPLLIACGLGLGWWCRSDYKKQSKAAV